MGIQTKSDKHSLVITDPTCATKFFYFNLDFLQNLTQNMGQDKSTSETHLMISGYD